MNKEDNFTLQNALNIPTSTAKKSDYYKKYDHIENSNLRTKKKSFVSEVDPLLVKRKIQRENYIWFGVYDELLRNKNILKYINQCKDTTLPIECAAIHLDKYRLGFSKNKSFISANNDSVIFFKLYLVTKDQFVDLLIHYYKFSATIAAKGNHIFQVLDKIDTEMDLTDYVKPDVEGFYNLIKCVGELDSILIYSITATKAEIAAPDTDVLRTIYLGLKKSFSPYSQYLIMYYIYLLDGVKNFYTIKQLQEVFFKVKSLTNNSSASSETNLAFGESNFVQAKIIPTIGENVNMNMNLNMIANLNNSPPTNKKDTDTVKCSTCNASPFMATPEKDQLNQYSYIFDLHHLPIFDDNTGEFFWNNNEVNWKTAKDSIFKSEELNNGKSLSMNHGSLVSLSNSFMMGGGGGSNFPSNKKEDNNVITTANTNANANVNAEQQGATFQNDCNSRTFIEELNNLLKEFENT